MKSLITGRHIPATAVVGASLAASAYLWANMGDLQTARWAGWPFVYDGLEHPRDNDELWKRARALNVVIFPAFFIAFSLAFTAGDYLARKVLPAFSPVSTTAAGDALQWLLTRRYSALLLVIASVFGATVVAQNLMIWGWYGYTGWPLTYYSQTDAPVGDMELVSFSPARMGFNVAALPVVLLAMHESIQVAISSLRYITRLPFTWRRTTAFGFAGASLGAVAAATIGFFFRADYLLTGSLIRTDDLPVAIQRMANASIGELAATGVTLALTIVVGCGTVRWRRGGLSPSERAVLIAAAGVGIYCALIAIDGFVRSYYLDGARFWFGVVLAAFIGRNIYVAICSRTNKTIHPDGT